MKKRLQQAQSEGKLPAEIQPADFARYLSSVMARLGIQAANGATRAELRRVAAIALRNIETAFRVLQAARSAARLARLEGAPWNCSFLLTKPGPFKELCTPTGVASVPRPFLPKCDPRKERT